jgi:hypothetical protein
MNAEISGNCDRCGSGDLRRLISKVSIGRPPMDPSKLNKQEMLDGVDYADPASMANFFRRMTDTFQDEPNEYMEDIVGRLDHGESVEHSLGLEHLHQQAEPESAGEAE